MGTRVETVDRCLPVICQLSTPDGGGVLWIMYARDKQGMVGSSGELWCWWRAEAREVAVAGVGGCTAVPCLDVHTEVTFALTERSLSVSVSILCQCDAPLSGLSVHRCTSVGEARLRIPD